MCRVSKFPVFGRQFGTGVDLAHSRPRVCVGQIERTRENGKDSRLSVVARDEWSGIVRSLVDVGVLASEAREFTLGRHTSSGIGG